MATMKQKINSYQVWREAIFKFTFTSLIAMIAYIALAHWTSYDMEPIRSLGFSIGIGLGNIVSTFLSPQTRIDE